MRSLIFLVLVYYSAILPLAGQNYVVEISRLQLIKPIKSYYLEEIIDLREDKSKIGLVYRSLNSDKRPAVFARSLPEEIQAIYKHNAAPGPEAIPVILKVNKLNISENLQFDHEIANAEFAFEFLVKQEDKYYKILEGGCQHELRANGDATKKHGKNLLYVLLNSFGQLNNINLPEKLKSAPAFGPEHLAVNTYYNPDFAAIPILSAETYNKGVYRNFQEFKNNQPGITALVFSKNGIKDKNGNSIKAFWGYSDGNTVFLKYGASKYLYPLVKEGNAFVFKANVTTVDKNAVIMGSMLGGLTGAMIAGALTEKHQLMDLMINPITGKITEVNAYGPKADLGKPHTMVLYRNKKNEKPEALTIFVNDSVYASLEPYSFKELTIDIPVSGKKICLDEAGNNCLLLNPITNQINYLEISSTNKAPGPVMKIVPEQEVVYYLKLIKHQANKVPN